MIYIVSKIFNILFSFLEYAIIFDVILSYVIRDRRNTLYQIVRIFTEPLLKPGRKIQQMIVPDLAIDFSPIFGFLIIRFLRYLLLLILGIF